MYAAMDVTCPKKLTSSAGIRTTRPVRSVPRKISGTAARQGHVGQQDHKPKAANAPVAGQVRTRSPVPCRMPSVGARR
jgi:hypothetical protein